MFRHKAYLRYNRRMKHSVYGRATYGARVVDEYIASLSGAEKAAVQHVYDLARQLAPDAKQVVSYGMPCLSYKGKGLVSVMVTKKFLSLYPFSNFEAVISREELDGFETTTGSIHFSPEHPLPDELVRKIISARMANVTK